MGLRRVKASDLIPNPKNWRKHPKAQADALRGVLAEVGYADALLARQLPDGGLMLVDGHLRAETTPDAEVPVLVLDVTEAEADKILLTLDPLAAMAEADAYALSSLLADFETDSEAVKKMLADLSDEAGIERPKLDDPPARIDEAEELRKKWGVERGQLWRIGGHRLLCGDSTSAEDVGRLLAGEKPMLMVTDPPYGVEYDPSWRGRAGMNLNPKKLGKVTNDDRADWTETWALFPGEVAYVYHAGVNAGLVQASLEAAGFEIRAQIVWAKDRMALSRGDYHWQHEPCWYAVKKGGKGHRTDDRTQSTLWQIPARDDDGHGHGTQKPVECMERPIRNHECDAVYEPFAGSGTTLIAAEQLGRRCFGLDIEPKYVAVALQRLADMGLTPERVDG